MNCWRHPKPAPAAQALSLLTERLHHALSHLLQDFLQITEILKGFSVTSEDHPSAIPWTQRARHNETLDTAASTTLGRARS